MDTRNYLFWYSDIHMHFDSCEIFWSWHICQMSHFLRVNENTHFSYTCMSTHKTLLLNQVRTKILNFKMKPEQLLKHLQEPRLSETWSHTFLESVRIPCVFLITFLFLVSRCELSPGFMSVPNYGDSPCAHLHDHHRTYTWPALSVFWVLSRLQTRQNNLATMDLTDTVSSAIFQRNPRGPTPAGTVINQLRIDPHATRFERDRDNLTRFR